MNTTMQAYKRSPALENSTWYKGILISQLAGTNDTNGAFDFAESGIQALTTNTVRELASGMQ